MITFKRCQFPMTRNGNVINTGLISPTPRPTSYPRLSFTKLWILGPEVIPGNIGSRSGFPLVAAIVRAAEIIVVEQYVA